MMLARGRLARNPSWPITALLVGYPLWWALGTADFMWAILAVPMAARMFAWRADRSRPLRVPPGFGLWLLFLICVVAGGAVLGLTAPGTVPSPVSHRALSYVDRTATYIGLTVLLLYTGNLTERELPRRRLAWMLGLVAIYATVGGVAAMLMPHLKFSSPVWLLLPHSVQSNPAIAAATHPALAQVQNVLGTANGRPKAPFDYTNTWGDCLTILVAWLIVGWWCAGTGRQRVIAASVIVIGTVPLLYSLDRGAWIGVGVSVGYVALRLAARVRREMVGRLCLGLVLVGVVVLATPLRSIVAARVSHGRSDGIRTSLSALAVTDALASPVIGYGDLRKQRGAPRSIAIGPTPRCPLCGQLEVGSTGQLWLLLICNGILGTALYLGFFVFGFWHYRRDGTPYGIAGLLVLLLSFVYMFVYTAVPTALGFTVLAYALLWRNDDYRRQQQPSCGSRLGSADVIPRRTSRVVVS